MGISDRTPDHIIISTAIPIMQRHIRFELIEVNVQLAKQCREGDRVSASTFVPANAPTKVCILFEDQILGYCPQNLSQKVAEKVAAGELSEGMIYDVKGTRIFVEFQITF